MNGKTSMTRMMKTIAMPGLMTLLVAGVTLPLLAQQAVTAPTPAPQATRVVIETEAEHRAKLAAEGRNTDPGGVTIHGHWIIDVKNADGTVAEHHDFYNAIGTDGTVTLANFLLGSYTPEYFSMSVSSNTTTYLITQAGGFQSKQTCRTGSVCLTGITQTLTPAVNFTPSGSVILSAQFAPASAMVFTNVSTNLAYCYETSAGFNQAVVSQASPTACRSTLPTTSSLNYTPFTGTALTTPLSVTAGQSLLITVTLSFS